MDPSSLIVERPIEPKVHSISVQSLQDSRGRFAAAQRDYIDSHTSAALLEALQRPSPFIGSSGTAAASTYRAQVDAVQKTISGDLSEVAHQRQALREISHDFARRYAASERKNIELQQVQSEIAQLKAELSGSAARSSSAVAPSIAMQDTSSSEVLLPFKAQQERAAAESAADTAERNASDAESRAEAAGRAADSAEGRVAALERAALDRAQRKVSSVQQVANARAWYGAAAVAGDRLLGVRVLEATPARVCLQVRGRGGPRRLVIGLRPQKGKTAGKSAGALHACAEDPSGFSATLLASVPDWATLSKPGVDIEDEAATSGWLEDAVASAAASAGDHGAAGAGLGVRRAGTGGSRGAAGGGIKGAGAIPPSQWVVLEVLKRI